jgi:hypothetical protein
LARRASARPFGNSHTIIVKQALLILLMAATVLCALQPLSIIGATDQSWLPMEQAFLAATVGVLILSTALLWARIRSAPALTVAAYLVFGIYHVGKIWGTMRAENYKGTAVLALLVFIGLCPFVAAIAAATWGGQFCRKGTQ